MDGNFQHRHNILASKDNPDEAQYPAIFVRPSEIAKHDTTTEPPPARTEEDNDDPCGEAHKTANDTRGASTWDKCDDTGLFAVSCRHDVPLLMANIYKSGEKMRYPLSLLQSLMKDFPDLCVGVLYDIGCVLNKHIKKHNKLPEYQQQLMLGTSVFHAYVHSWGCQLTYNPRFLDFWGLSDGEGLERLCYIFKMRIFDQSQSNAFSHLATSKIEQRQLDNRRSARHIEHVLSGLQKEVTTSEHRRTPRFANNFSWASSYAWKTVCIRSELQAFDCLARFQDLVTQIAELRGKVGLSDLLNRLPRAGQDCFLKLWFAKTEVRSRFLSLRAEQRPLDPENRVGGSSRLGTHKKEHIMLAIQLRTRTMKKTLTNYNNFAREFQALHPEVPTSPVVEYSVLIHMQADDPVNRGQEEMRRLGWEIRRSMRWLTHEHERLWKILTYLRDDDDTNETRELIQKFKEHKVIESLSTSGKIDVIKTLTHNTFVKLCTLTIHWDQKAMEVLMRTPPQLGDLELMTCWKSQRHRIDTLHASGCGSTREGDFEHLFENLRLDDVVVQPQDLQAADPLEDGLSDFEDGEWENGLDAGMLINMMDNIGLEN
ncbi:uncharacterized protein MELLADRAFT_92206 [Melampsora larici-populina 98AG31]|uniref:CxC1-like cysteine cluster associated with KDZ transposases domain-containing protein n=1 Tax=Melampsora larici-populina (strain 98AG31 / pathotype 3-4-7) TaxID=747676 RepID=F4R8S7_MELLP|nr:uncharacterized protein MELLADRAFT_92206 [Melampsora larici-populina 98AG31]EGG11274.1 hypothetical protein MELLADRAFT_92206 [Melampsora larici-populina 98AG31]